MTAKRLISPLVLLMYALVPVIAYRLVRRSTAGLETLVLDVVLASIPLVLVAAVTWRLVWPRWKLVAKLLLHPCIYAILSVYVGHWSILAAWLHQGVLGLGWHIWFSRKHGFTWYSVEDPERYVALSKEMVGTPSRDQTSYN